MAEYTLTYGLDDTTEKDVICHFDGVDRIAVQENYDSAIPPTSDLLQRGRIPGSSQVRVSKGVPAIFASGPYFYGQKVGTIECGTAGANITVQQIESKTL